MASKQKMTKRFTSVEKFMSTIGAAPSHSVDAAPIVDINSSGTSNVVVVLEPSS